MQLPTETSGPSVQDLYSARSLGGGAKKRCRKTEELGKGMICNCEVYVMCDGVRCF